MSNTKPENMIISNEIMRAYATWKKKLSETQLGDRVPSLAITVLCKLIAKGQCNNDELCGGCPAAKESFVWMRDKMVSDGVVDAKEGIGVPYESNEVGGFIVMSDGIVGRNGVTNLSIWDGYSERGEEKRTAVTLSIG